MAVKLTSLSYLGMAVETTLGTPVASTGFIPVRGFKPQDVLKYIDDVGKRGFPVDRYGAYLGPTSSEYEIDGDFYPTSGGNLLASVFGTDTVSGVSPGPYTHTFTVNPTPGSITFGDYYVAGYRQWAGQKVDKLSLKFTPEAGLSYTAHSIGFPSVTATAPSSETFGTNPYLLGWEAALTIDGTADSALDNFTIDLNRLNSEALFSAQNSQKPFDVFVGEMSADMTLGFYMEADTEYAYALSQGTHAVVVTVTQGGSGDVLTLQASKVQFTRPTIDRAGKYVRVTLQGEALYNATDSGVALAKLQNAVATAYTTTSAS